MQAKARIGGGSIFIIYKILEGGQYCSVDIFETDVDIWGLLMDFLWHYSQVQKVSPKYA